MRLLLSFTFRIVLLTRKIFAAPLYLSPRSADVVLSEIRPTRLAPDALRSVNVLLDELLWMILSMARSFATDQLKAALSKLLPTSLGKEALLEAEVELRAYWDRTSNAPSRPYSENPQEFPIQPAFEVRTHPPLYSYHHRAYSFSIATSIQYSCCD